MRRRNLVALVAALGLLGLGLLFVIAAGVVTRTGWGHQFVADFVVQRLGPSCKCTWYVGPISGGLLSGATIDSVAVRGEDGELFFSARRVSVSYDFRDLVDNRFHFRRVTIDKPYVQIREFEDGSWNYRKIFPEKKKSALEQALKPVPLILFDSVTVTDGNFDVWQRWRPDSLLRGAARDSAIREHVTRIDQIYQRTPDGIKHRYQWIALNAFLPHLRLSHPNVDSTRGEKLFVVGSLQVTETDPQFDIRDFRGEVRILAETTWVNVPRFVLPGSMGSVKGTVVRGSGLPVRLDLRVRGDSVLMNDIAWIYPTLPRTGGGRMLLHIKSDPRNPNITDYALSKLDVRSTKSHVTGGMTFSVGGPVLGVRNVDLVADPVDFDLIRVFSGGPLPVDWQGQLFGRVKGAGGPVNDFDVESLQAEWRDTKVPGAVSRFGGSGTLDIVSPADAVFKDFRADIASLDLRSIRALFPTFPPLGGTLSGRATLDSLWSDVRFHDADVTHRDGPGEPTRVTGSGRITTGTVMSYDVALEASAIGLEMLKRSYPVLPFRGVFAGPIRARGTTSDLELSANLQGASAAFSWDGRVDLDSVGGYSARGRGQAARLDLRTLLVDTTGFSSRINGQYEADVTWTDAPLSIAGRLALDLDRSRVDSVDVTSARAVFALGGGKARLADPLSIVTPLATLTAPRGGGIGLAGGSPDSLRFAINDIRLDALRGYFPSFKPDDSLSAVTLQVDSTAVLSGTLDTLRVRATLRGTELALSAFRARRAAVTVDIDRALGDRRGVIALRGDSVMVGRLAFATTFDTLQFYDSTTGTYAIHARADSRPDLDAFGAWIRDKGVTTARTQTLRLGVPDDEWKLASPASLILDRMGMRLDLVELRNRDSSGSISFGGMVPDSGPATFNASGSGIRLRDIAAAAQLRDSYDGLASFAADATGTKAAPIMALRSLTIDSLRVALQGAEPVSVARATATASYRDRTLDADVRLFPTDTTATVTARASLPMELTLFGGRPLQDSIAGRIVAAGLQLPLLQPLFEGLSLRGGTVSGTLDFAGKRSDPRFFGDATILEGLVRIDSLYTELKGVQGRLVLRGDTVTVESLIARTEVDVPRTLIERVAGRPLRETGTAGLNGRVWGWKNPRSSGCDTTGGINPRLDLGFTARDFLVMNDPALAIVSVTTARGSVANPDTLRLTGCLDNASISGSVLLPRAVMFMPDPGEVTKQVGELEDFLASAGGRAADSLPRRSDVMDRLLTNLNFPTDSGRTFTVALGEDVRLRTIGSDVVDVKLASIDPLRVVRNREFADASLDMFIPSTWRGIGLTGEMTAVSGSYVFELGPVQRDFTVLQGGSVTFRGDLNPQLNITTRTTQRVSGQQDTRLNIFATLSGKLDSVGLEFTSDQSYPISESDLVSYLATGRPRFALDEGTLASIVASSGGSFLGRQLRSKLHLDAAGFELSGSAFQGSARAQDKVADFLSGGRFYGEKQLNDAFYFKFDAGLCAVRSLDYAQLLDALGGSLVYRLPDVKDSVSGVPRPRPGAPSVRVSWIPPSASQFCTPGTVGLNGLAPTPRQFGISLQHRFIW